MAQRNQLTRQKSLDFGQSKSAMKVLEKYCRKKYCNSTLIATGSLPAEYDPLYTPEPKSPGSIAPQSMYSQCVSSTPSWVPQPSGTGLDRPTSLFPRSEGRPIPSRVVSEFFEPPIKEEIKQRPQETRRSHVWRVIKFLYERFKLRYVVVVLGLVLYSLLGGAMFHYLEAPAEMQRHELHLFNANRRHREFADCFCANRCDQWLRRFQAASNLTRHRLHRRSEEGCSQEIRRMLQIYDVRAGFLPSGKKIWVWNDYWSAVFYAWTLLTTIGYGNLSCYTVSGRILTILYALIGIPLMLIALNALGKMCFLSVQHIWEQFRAKVKRKTKRFHKRIFLQPAHHGSDDEFMEKDMKLASNDSSDFDDEADIFQTFPLRTALLIVFLYISLCSLIFSVWEEWDYFTAFYFFFISLSTIGLGDEVPQQPHYACAFFIFFVIGLSLVSMCVSIIQMRIENQYMAALQLIDEEHRNGIEPGVQVVADPETASSHLPDSQRLSSPPADPNRVSIMQPTFGFTPSSTMQPFGFTPNPTVTTSAGVRWRNRMFAVQLHATSERPPFMDELDAPARVESLTPKSCDLDSAPRSPVARMPSMSTLSTTSSNLVSAPPVLSALLSRRRSTKRLKQHPLMRADSIRSTLHDEMSATPCSPLSERLYWPGTPSDMKPSKSPPLAHGGIPPNLARSSVYNASLSVITEASDEDVRDQMQRKKDSQKRRPSSLLQGEPAATEPEPAASGIAARSAASTVDQILPDGAGGCKRTDEHQA